MISKISLIPKSMDHSPIKRWIIYHLKDGKNQLHRSYERRSITWITGGRKRRRKAGGRDEGRREEETKEGGREVGREGERKKDRT